jgi:uncharacterized membrane protein YeaQ/YmgE (transglycosylase-associated protein family)
MIRISLFILSLISLFTFPWPYTVLLVFLFSLFVPLGALAFGILADALYYVQGSGFPMATLLGCVGYGVAFFMSRFIRHRITDFSLD